MVSKEKFTCKKNRELPYPIELDIQQEKKGKTRKISEKAKKHEKKLAQ